MKLYSTLRKYIINTENISLNGVYKIWHTEKPHLIYIGSACRNAKKQCRKGVYGRWVEHFSSLKNNKHHSKYLQNVVNKYGIEGLRFEIIYYSNTDTQEQIRLKEEEFIKFYNSYNKGYNSCATPFLVTLSEEVRQLSSERMKKNNPMHNPEMVKKMLATKAKNSRYVLQYTLEGEFIKKYKNYVEASIEVKVDKSQINKAAKGVVAFKSAGSIWIFEEDFTEELLISKILKNKTKKSYSEERRLKLIGRGFKPIITTNILTKEEIEFTSIRGAAQILKLDPGAISKCCNNKQKSVKGFTIKFKI